MYASVKRHWTTAGSIIQGLYASAVACAHQRLPMAGSISQGLHVSNVACALRASDVGQRQMTSGKACTHQPWRVRISWTTSASANNRRQQLIFTRI